ncbi:glycosyltransferase family 4 protein [Sulfurospirillum oryzae]|uniref:glycosyltransferase family 4 protein n=1 Tax=Sulfurospirillum oryzae TaxID=2976535 RepID=UPI0021E7FCF5|nr:glycosyltransferase family 1 protein [Sulfurospirillum oryzae]
MKILIDGRVLTHSKITGVENHAINLIEKLKSIADIYVAIPKYQNKYYTHFWEHVVLPLKAIKYDLLFCPSNIAPFYLSKKVKLIVTLHDLSYKDFSQMYSKAFRRYYEFVIPRVLQRAEHVLTISKFSYERIIREYPFVQDKIDFIYHGKNEIFTFEPSIQKEDYILYVGSLNDTKNFSFVIKAFDKLNSKKYYLKMIMPISSNFEINKEKKQLLEHAKKNSKIEIVDYLPQEKLVEIYQKAKLFIFPSYHESFGFPVLEAMACGTSVVCSGTSSLPEVGGDAVVYCDPYDINDIKNKIESVLNDENMQQEMIKKGLERAKMFTWDKSAKEYLEVLKKLDHKEIYNF